MRTRIFSIALTLALAFSMAAAPFAWAADGAEAAGNASGDTGADDVTLSSDGLSAVIEGCAFALGDFARAQVGSNREIDGEYHGYAYKIAGGQGRLSVIVSGDLTLVYVPPTSSSAGFDMQDDAQVAQMKELISALDAANASGKGGIPDTATWRFTSDDELTIDGITYRFDREIAGNAYDCVIGADGSDITDTDNPLYKRLNHASFATVIPAQEAIIKAPPTWFESLQEFMANLNWSPLWVTLRTTLTAIVFIFVLGLAAAYFCLHRSPKARNVFDTIFTIPMVLPPTVCGFLLLLLLGNNTALGRWFIDVGFPLVFSWPATVIAAVVVAFPLMYRNALGAFDNLDPNMLDAARTLGWSESRIFFKIMLPLSWSSIAAGTVLAFARALGEFGATLFLAGNYLGITRTIPIAIYFEWMNGNTDIALFWTLILVVFSFIVIMFINLWSNHTTRYRKGVSHE